MQVLAQSNIYLVLSLKTQKIIVRKRTRLLGVILLQFHACMTTQCCNVQRKPELFGYINNAIILIAS